jgi:hypothetical protein
MTERIKALAVMLDKDVREDDVAALVDAIKMLRGVLTVTTNVATIDDDLAYARARFELQTKLWEVLKK